MSAILGFLYHPNIWIQQGMCLRRRIKFAADRLIGAATFISSAAQHLPSSDIWCILYPSLRHFLRSDIAEIDTLSLLGAMKPPVRYVEIVYGMLSIESSPAS